MKTKKISEQLRTCLSILETSPSSLRVKVWQRANGTRPTISLNIFLAFVFSYTLTYSTISEEERFLNIFVVGALVLVSGCSYFWLSRRQEAKDLADDMAVVAEAIEEIATPDQLAHMEKFSWWSNTFVNLNYFGVVVAQVVYVTFPIISGMNLGTVPALPKSRTSFWTMYVLISFCALTGPLALASFLAYQSQTCISLMGLFQTMKSQIQDVNNNQHLNYLIIIHQKLVNIAYNLRGICSEPIFTVIAMAIVLLIAQTCLLFTMGINPGVFFVISIIVAIVYNLCALGEAIQQYSVEVGGGAYSCAWYNKGRIFQKKMILIIARCQRPCSLRAGIIGAVEKKKFTQAMKMWYRFVQALLNFS